MKVVIPFTSDMAAQLVKERERTGVGASALLKPYKNLPKGLNVTMITHMLSCKVKKVKAIHYEFVAGAWATLPDNSRIEITEEMRLELVKGRSKNTLSMQSLQRLRGLPKGLTRAKHYGIMNGSVKTAHKVHYDFLKSLYVSNEG